MRANFFLCLIAVGVATFCTFWDGAVKKTPAKPERETVLKVESSSPCQCKQPRKEAVPTEHRERQHLRW